MDTIAVRNVLVGSARRFERVEDLVGLIPLRVQATDDELHIYFTEDAYAMLFHSQDCCESVYIESIVGDLDDLVGEPLLRAEEASSDDDSGNYESATWTFYKFATIKGYVDIRFLGTSNGYYSESVSFVFHDPRGEFNSRD